MDKFGDELVKWIDNTVIELIYDLPFLQELIHGTLNLSAFQFYIIQDAIYLHAFSKVFALAATKAENEDILYLLEMSKGMIEEALQLHYIYFKKWGIDPLQAKPSKSCLLYISFLENLAHTENLLEIICASLPCPYVYMKVGNFILQHEVTKNMFENHPFKEWIDTYASDEFAESCNRYVKYINKISKDVDLKRMEKCKEYVKLACEMEYLFWNSAHVLEEWPLEKKLTIITERNKEKNNPICCLTIAGSDSGGGAGIQADLNVFNAHHVFGTSAITSLTAQNTTGVEGIFPVSPEFLKKQIECVMNDISIKGIKTGMLFSSELIETVVETLQRMKKDDTYLVIDPVMISTSGYDLLKPEAVEVLIRKLFPIATLITPNIPEAIRILQVVTKEDKPYFVNNEEEIKVIAKQIAKLLNVSAVLVKGGHLTNCNFAIDVLYQLSNDQFTTFKSPFIQSNNSHGTGCALSSAITSNLALGNTLENSIRKAKRYVYQAIIKGFTVGKGYGTLNHILH
ncbi:hypothetical protein ABK040_010628 [Willaertia magna]